MVKTTKETYYSKSPIVEALFEVRVEYSNPFEDKLTSFYDQLKAKYPKRESLPQTRFKFQVRESEKPEMSEVPVQSNLHKFFTEDGLNSIQISNVGIVIGRLKPYEKWDSFKKEIEDTVTLFLESFEVASIERCGLRYINRIELNPDELEDKLLTFPTLNFGKHPVLIHNSNMQFHVYSDEFDLNGLVNQTITPVAEEKDTLLEVVLDFDIIKVKSMAPKIESIISLLSPMRSLKNDLFESSCSDVLKGEFK